MGVLRSSAIDIQFAQGVYKTDIKRIVQRYAYCLVVLRPEEGRAMEIILQVERYASGEVRACRCPLLVTDLKNTTSLLFHRTR